MRKLLSALLAMIVLLCVAVPAAAVEDMDGLRKAMIESYASDVMTDYGIGGQDALTSVDISKWSITSEELDQIFYDLYYGGYLPWYSGSNYSYMYDENDIVMSFSPMVMDVQTFHRELYEQKLAELMAEACLPGMTDWQLALSVHNYIIQHIAYDQTYEMKTGYDGLVNGTTVCNGYATLYMDVMNRLGIPCQMVICEDTGDGEGHGWNLIQLDGQWYHVDLTWDDPMPNIYGYVSYDNFLKTDAELKNAEIPHDFEWVALEEVALDPYVFDDFLDSSVSEFCFPDAVTAVYRIEREDIHQIWSMDLTTGEEMLLYEFDYLAIDLGDGTYWYPTRGFCFWNGRIYFNREDSVLSMLPDGSDVQEVYYREPDDRYIFGSFVDEGVLYLTLMDSEFNQTSMEVELEGVEFHTHSYETYTQEATCEAAGFTEQYCSCGITCNDREIPQLDHTLLFDEMRAATVEETGLIWIHCENCDFEQWDEVPKLSPPAKKVAEETGEYLPVVASVALTILLLGAIRRKGRKKR